MNPREARPAPAPTPPAAATAHESAALQPKPLATGRASCKAPSTPGAPFPSAAPARQLRDRLNEVHAENALLGRLAADLKAERDALAAQLAAAQAAAADAQEAADSDRRAAAAADIECRRLLARLQRVSGGAEAGVARLERCGRARQAGARGAALPTGAAPAMQRPLTLGTHVHIPACR